MNKGLVLIALVSFYFLTVIISCQSKIDKTNILQKQNQEILKVYGINANLLYKYYQDSIIKEVCEKIQGEIRGKQVLFSPLGTIRNITFINKEGKKVGDESNYNERGELIEHLFWDASDNLLCRINFKNGVIHSVEGKPWYLFGYSDKNIGDTAKYYIATPIIPKHVTHVEFGLIDDTLSIVRYVNDIRQFEYKILMNTSGVKVFKLKVGIINDRNIEILCDSTQISTKII